jgi:hypothetical protein
MPRIQISKLAGANPAAIHFTKAFWATAPGRPLVLGLAGHDLQLPCFVTVAATGATTMLFSWVVGGKTQSNLLPAFAFVQ